MKLNVNYATNSSIKQKEIKQMGRRKMWGNLQNTITSDMYAGNVAG